MFEPNRGIWYFDYRYIFRPRKYISGYSEKLFHLTDFITNPYKRLLVSDRNFALELIIFQYSFEIYIWRGMQQPNSTPKTRLITKRLSMLTSSWLKKFLSQVSVPAMHSHMYHHWVRFRRNAHIYSSTEKVSLPCWFLCKFVRHTYTVQGISPWLLCFRTSPHMWIWSGQHQQTFH